MKQRRRAVPAAPHAIDPLTRLWILRMLVPLAGHRELVGGRGFSDDALARALGLDEWIDPEDHDFEPAAVRARLRELHRQAERRAERALPPILRANIERLADLVGISDAECRILGFATMLHHERELDKAADTLGLLSSPAIAGVLAALLDLGAG
jgi:hypothetical protein